MSLKDFGNFLGDLSRVAKSGRKAVKTSKRVLDNASRLNDEEREALCKQALGKALEHVASSLAGPEVVVVGVVEDD